MYPSHMKESFSFAYAVAVISAAGYNYTHPVFDYNSVDFSIRGTANEVPHAYPCLDVQLKCTSEARLTRDFVHHRLPRKNYDDLRRIGSQSRILIVVLVPHLTGHWLNSSDRRMRLQRCGYWMSLRNQPAVDQETITVRLPRSQRFTIEGLRSIMTTLEQGGEI
jgi:hypothetical protein